jgi:simple sugar transport system permease protein
MLNMFIDKFKNDRDFKLLVSIIGVFIFIFLIFLIGSPKVFLKPNIYYSFMSTIPFFGIMALAMTFVVILGEIDLSFASVLAVASWIFGKTLEVTGYIWFAAFAALAFGVLAGLINSVLIVRIGIPSIVATIGTMFFWRGAVNVLAEGHGISLVAAKETFFYDLCVGRPFGIPAQAIWFIVLGVLFYFILKRHKFGSHVLFVGDNKESAKMMGINVNLVKTIVYLQMGFFAAFAGILSTLEVTYFWPSQGQGYLLTTLAAVFIGGTSVFGGKGTIIGTFIGALIIGSLEAGIIALGLTAFWLQFVYGLIITISVSVYALMIRKKE